MNTNASPENQYKVGGCLSPNHPTYVKRQADDDFYYALKAGKFCYVLNSRQMGKSSLRVRTIQRLQEDNFICAGIEISTLCDPHVTPEKWYAAFHNRLITSISQNQGLETQRDNWRQWWKLNEVSHLPPLERLKTFIEEKLLTDIANQDIIIFVDEVDSLIDLPFKNSFFAFIRECYNYRSTNNKYKRLTFALLGVAAPSDLIEKFGSAPFDIGQRIDIDLTGFEIEDTKPLQSLLEGKIRNPRRALDCVLYWTGGQPLLTQWLCETIFSHASEIQEGREDSCIRNLVNRYIIAHCFVNNKQEHFKTIRYRLLNSSNPIRLLEIYQKIIQEPKRYIPSEDSQEYVELRLTGLVIQQNNRIKVYNRIYERIFNQTWVEIELEKLSPRLEARIYQGLSSEYFYYLLCSPFEEKTQTLQKIKLYLERENIRVALIDSKRIDTRREAKDFEWESRGTWYMNFAECLNRDLELNSPAKDWWNQSKRLRGNPITPDIGRELLISYIKNKLLTRRNELDVVIIFDVVIAQNIHDRIKYQHLFENLSFKDEVFDFIRLFYERHEEHEDHKKLGFLVIDTAINPEYSNPFKDKKISVVWQIDLRNSIEEPILIYREGLRQIFNNSNYHRLLTRIWYWTNGHLFLIQKVFEQILIKLLLASRSPIMKDKEEEYIDNFVKQELVQPLLERSQIFKAEK